MRQEGLKEACFDQVFDSQKNFRVLMEAMSRPGEIYKLHKINYSSTPEGLNSNLLTMLKTLGDSNVTFALGNIESDEIKKYIELNTGMTVSEISEADHVIFNGEKFDKSFLKLNTGTLEFPEGSATVFIETDSILSGEFDESFIARTVIIMQGPGIKEKNTVTVHGLDKEYIRCMAELNRVFPLGIDAFFIDKESNITCMPRTTKAEVR